MKGITKIVVVAMISLGVHATAISANLPEKHRNLSVPSSTAGHKSVVPSKGKGRGSESRIRHVILPAEKKPEKPPIKKESAPSSEQNFSPYLTKSDEATLREPLKAYRAHNIASAIAETKRLLAQKEPVAEVAAYFLGEFYLKQADEGGKEAIPNALAAFKNAVVQYPKSNRVTFGKLRWGEVSIRQRFYNEAIGIFERIAESGVEDRFVLKAEMGIANTYQSWGRWEEAKKAYEGLLRRQPPLLASDRSVVLLGHTDVLYQMGQFEDAYQGYKTAALANPNHRSLDPEALFQFAEAGYRARHSIDAKSAFLDFYNIYPTHPLASVALARVETILKGAPAPGGDGRLAVGVQTVGPLKKKATQARVIGAKRPPHTYVTLVTPALPSIHDTLKRLATESVHSSVNDPASNLGRILLAMEAIQKCLQTVPLKIMAEGEPQFCNRPLGEEAFYPRSQLRLGLREGIKNNALDLLNSGPPSTTAQGILLEAIYQLKKYKEIEAVIEIETTLLIKLPVSSPYIKEVEDTLHETIVKELDTIRDPEKIVTLYYGYPAAFTKEMLSGEIGYTIGMSHIRTGLLGKGVALLKPVSENTKSLFWQEALYQTGKASLALGDYGKAQQALEQFQRVSVEKEKAFADLGHLHFKRGDAPRAVVAYERWLSHFPKHPDRADVYLKLSEAYRYQNDYDNEIKVYSKWIAEGKGVLDIPYMRLADTFFQLAQYKKAISSYRVILENGSVGEKEMEWAKLRLATSYELSGQEKEGKKYFESISQKTKSPLIRQIAAERTRPS